MMGLFVMAAMMGFQSIPIGQAVSQEITQSFTDLSRVAETKSYGDLYYFNFVPNGAEHSVNNMSYNLGQQGGNVTWDQDEFTYEEGDNIEFDVRTKTNEIMTVMQGSAQEYFNEKYGGVSQSGGCGIPPINYSIKTFPDSSDILQDVRDHENKINILVGSQVEVDYSGYGLFPTMESAPMEVECAYDQGSTKYIGDTQNSGEDSSSSPYGGYGLGFQSIGFTNKLESDANRYHVMANKTAYIYKRVFNNWVKVEETTNTKENVCNPSHSDWEEVERETVNDVGSEVNTGWNSIVDNEINVEGMSGEFELWPFSLDLKYDTYTRNYNGEASYSKTFIERCDCHDDHDDSYGEHCHEDEYDLHVTMTPNVSIAFSNITDDDYHINTEEGWKNLEFNVDYYSHNYKKDYNEE